MKNKLFTIAILASLASFATADSALFDFEAEPGSSPNSTDLTSLTMTDGGSGFSLTISRDSGAGFGVMDTSPFVGSSFDFPPSWGSRSIDPFGDSTDDWFVVDFSQGASGFSLELGDFGADSDDVELEAYSGLGATGSLINSNMLTGYTGNMDLDGSGDFLSVSSGVPDIMSVRFRGGSSVQTQSLYYDNFGLEFEAVPEPATMAILAAGATLALRRRKKA